MNFFFLQRGFWLKKASQKINVSIGVPSDLMIPFDSSNDEDANSEADPNPENPAEAVPPYRAQNAVGRTLQDQSAPGLI
jgi:hypothetical protein